MQDQADSLRKQIESTEAQLRNLKSQLQQVELEAEAVRQTDRAHLGHISVQRGDGTFDAPQQAHNETVATSTTKQSGASYETGAPQPAEPVWPLLDNEYRRYGRQMIMPEVGLQGQLRLKNAKVLVIGVGGLGCPAAAYLAGAGIGTLGLMDGDTVELSNLHRQIAHATMREGMSKVDSAYEYLHSYVETLNPSRRVLSDCSFKLEPFSTLHSLPLPSLTREGGFHLRAVRPHTRLHRSSNIPLSYLRHLRGDR